MDLMTYEQFLEELAKHESQGSGDYEAENEHGYLGRYQMGEGALIDAEYKDKSGKWTGKNGVYSKQQFKENPAAQEDAIRTYHEKIYGYIQSFGLDRYEGKEINGVRVTQYGLIAGWHLKGGGESGATSNDAQGLINYLESNGSIDPVDGNGTPVSKYMEDMAGSAPIRGFPLPQPKPTPPENGGVNVMTPLSANYSKDVSTPTTGGRFFSSVGSFFSGIGSGIADFFGRSSDVGSTPFNPFPERGYERASGMSPASLARHQLAQKPLG